MAKPNNVYEAINQVMEAVDAVFKEKSDTLRYSIVTEGALLSALRPHMVKQELTIAPIAVDVVNREPYTTSQGSTWINILAVHTYRISHASSDTHLEVQVLGEGADSGDKAANKAMTVSLKYALRQTFLIETGDDPDKTPSDLQERQFGSTSSSTTSKDDNEPATPKAIEAWGALALECSKQEIEVPELPSPITMGKLRELYSVLNDAYEVKLEEAK